MKNCALIAILLAFAATARRGAEPGSSGSLANAAAPAAPSSPARARWMDDRLNWLGKLPLKRLTLPASHDAGMYLSEFPSSLGQSQALSIYGQLSAGVRYFDLRPRWASRQLSIHHGPVPGPKLDDVLDDVRRFAREGRRELVILKFSHYEGFDDTAAYPALVELIKAKLGPWLFTARPKDKRLADVTLGEYVEHGPAILVVCDEQYPVDHPSAGIWIYRDFNARHPEQADLIVFDQYANTTSFEKMKADQLAKFERFDGKCQARPDVPCDLFLLSWTLTPTTNVRHFAAQANPKLKPALAELKIPNRFGCVVNLLYTDYCDDAGATDEAIRLNETQRR